MRIPFICFAFLITCLCLACDSEQRQFTDALVGSWEVSSVELTTEDGDATPATVGGVLRLTRCDGTPNFNPCPATFVTHDGVMYEMEWAGAFDFDGVNRLDISGVFSSNEADRDTIAGVLDRPWNVELINDELRMNLAHVNQTFDALNFRPLTFADLVFQRVR